MRKLLIAIGIVLVLVMAAPFVVGIIAEGTVRARLDAMNENRLVALRVESYDRGWLKSRTRLELGIGDSYLSQIEAATQQPQVTQVLRSLAIPVIVEFTHGPILVGEVSGLGFLGVEAYADPKSQVIELAETFLGVPYLFRFRGKSEFGDGFRFSGEIPPFEGGFGDYSYEFAGVEVAGVSSLDHLELEAVLGDASLQGPLLSAMLESLRLTSDSEFRPGSFSLGTSEATLGRLAVINPSLGASPMLTAENVSVATTTSENAEATHFNAQVLYRIGHLAVADAFEVSDAALGLRAGHLDTVAVNEIVAAADLEQMADDPAAMMASVMPLVDRIVAGSPELAIDPLQFTLAEGEFKGRVQLGIVGSALPTGSINDLMNPTVALQAITADAEITAAKPLVAMLAGLVTARNMPPRIGPDGDPLPPEQLAAEVDTQVAQSLGMLTAFGFLQDGGDNYRCAIMLKDGELTANGQPVPLPF
jgi:uncharacterized protein YdgA (DUF945 family)